MASVLRTARKVLATRRHDGDDVQFCDDCSRTSGTHARLTAQRALRLETMLQRRL